MRRSFFAFDRQDFYGESITSPSCQSTNVPVAMTMKAHAWRDRATGNNERLGAARRNSAGTC